MAVRAPSERNRADDLAASAAALFARLGSESSGRAVMDPRPDTHEAHHPRPRHIFDLGDRTVLRRQRGGRSLEAEAAVMRHVSAHGFPCPTVHRADGPEMVLDLLDGSTMTHDL